MEGLVGSWDTPPEHAVVLNRLDVTRPLFRSVSKSISVSQRARSLFAVTTSKGVARILEKGGKLVSV